MDVATLTAAQARELRQAVLRPNVPFEQNIYPGDDDPASLHVGLYDDGVLVAVGSMLNQPPQGEADPAAWRLRGMAVAEKYRNRGLGARVLEICIAYASESGGSYMWCNARAAARTFYERAGFLAEGDPFEVAASGPHYIMRKIL
ncbi:MAG: GNAT family N-acetyltransferase [Candidatus Eremiobacteraeota bacterium]|nr:GNAT family N-acetyltransferase [Candidatus Eremiobacteraeota bacterium]